MTKSDPPTEEREGKSQIPPQWRKKRKRASEIESEGRKADERKPEEMDNWRERQKGGVGSRKKRKLKRVRLG